LSKVEGVFAAPNKMRKTKAHFKVDIGMRCQSVPMKMESSKKRLNKRMNVSVQHKINHDKYLHFYSGELKKAYFIEVDLSEKQSL